MLLEGVNPRFGERNVSVKHVLQENKYINESFRYGIDVLEECKREAARP